MRRLCPEDNCPLFGVVRFGCHSRRSCCRDGIQSIGGSDHELREVLIPLWSELPASGNRDRQVGTGESSRGIC